MYSNLYEDCVVNPRRDKCWIVQYSGLCGLSAQATDWYKEAVPPG